MKVEMVIPLGNGDPQLDAPEISLLLNRLYLIKSQTIPVKLTLAVDSNFNNEKLERVKEYADKVVTFSEDSFFTPGSIWDKIYTCWEQ